MKFDKWGGRSERVGFDNNTYLLAKVIGEGKVAITRLILMLRKERWVKEKIEGRGKK